MSENLYWKDEIGDLRDRAAAVMASPAGDTSVSARAAAKCLVGIVQLVSRRWTVDIMQRTCAELARCKRAWETSLGALPHKNGIVGEPMQLIACVARGILPLAGIDNVRAALSFWASEDDPAVWSSVATT